MTKVNEDFLDARGFSYIETKEDEDKKLFSRNNPRVYVDLGEDTIVIWTYKVRSPEKISREILNDASIFDFEMSMFVWQVMRYI